MLVHGYGVVFGNAGEQSLERLLGGTNGGKLTVDIKPHAFGKVGRGRNNAVAYVRHIGNAVGGYIFGLAACDVGNGNIAAYGFGVEGAEKIVKLGAVGYVADGLSFDVNLVCKGVDVYKRQALLRL